MCVKCAGQHDIRSCSRIIETPPIAKALTWPIIPSVLHYWLFWSKRLLVKKETCAKLSTKHAPPSTEIQNKARNIICNGRITSTTLTASANRTFSQSETIRSNRRYQSNRPGQFLKIISLVRKYYTKCTNNLERVVDEQQDS